MVSDSHLSDLPALSDQELEEAVTRVDEEERSLSDLRGRVIAVHDALQSELVRRYKQRLGGLSG
jgi:hypothetical protein